ncbi:MAG TPA: carboxypeptidase-like regulatory domain-containing protein, partial [Terracidiphilus sp.]|nr:carboxypeptidase-like regulatory domain-containing protein [Terracidiphilus sp.]
MRFPRLIALLTIFATALPASAQIAGELTGRVLDASGRSVPNATVELVNLATNVAQTTASTSSGDYVFINLTSGSYQLKVSASGFERLSRSGVTVVTGQTVSADLILTIGAQQQTVTVTGDAPLLQAATSNIQTTIPAPTIAAMPLNTRNFVQLATLAPGVELPPGTVLPRINGGRPRTNEYLFDGISALQPEP